MPTYGPWVTPDPVDGTAVARWGGTASSAHELAVGGWISFGTDIDGDIGDAPLAGGHATIPLLSFGARSDVTGHDNDHDYAGRLINDTSEDPSVRNGVVGWQIGGARISFALAQSMLLDGVGMEAPHPTLPPGALGYEIEGSSDPDFAWLTSDVTIDADSWEINPDEYVDDIEFGRIDTGHGIGGTVYYRHNPTPVALVDLFTPLSTSDVSALPLLTSEVFDGTATIYQPHLVIPRDQLPTTGSDGRIEIVVVTSSFMAGTPPAHPPRLTDRAVNVPGYPEGWYFQGGVGNPPDPDFDAPPGCVYTFTYTYQPPRYRFVYDDVAVTGTVEAWATFEGSPAAGTELWG